MYNIPVRKSIPPPSGAAASRLDEAAGRPISIRDLPCLCSKSEMHGSSEPFAQSIKTVKLM